MSIEALPTHGQLLEHLNTMRLLSVLSSLLSAQHAVCLLITSYSYNSGQRQCAHQISCTTFHPQRQMLMQQLFSHGITSSQMSLPFAPLGAESWSKTQIHQANSLYAPGMEYTWVLPKGVMVTKFMTQPPRE